MTDKLWGGRFQKPTARDVEEFTSSLPFDRQLWSEDILASIAHAAMLGKQQIISEADSRQIIEGLASIYREITDGQASFTSDQEDIHSYVEGRLSRLTGPVAGRLHTARSRNDQVATDMRLWMRGALCGTCEAIIGLQQVLCQLAERHQDATMPGYTHLQRAQPILLGHHLLAYFFMLHRDFQRLQDCYRRMNILPLGSGALAGVPYPLDREYVADLLGFDGTSDNSLDAVSDRDFVAEYLFCLALLATHLSRLSEEIVLWSTAEFGFLELDDAYCTGSSIMPQKKNPDVAELVRGKTGRVYGALMAVLTMLKGLPLSYNRDFQEDKEPVFDATVTIQGGLRLLAGTMATARFRLERMAQAAGQSFGTATDLADFLVKKGLPFREAHGIVGSIVLHCLEHGRELADLSGDELATFSPLLSEGVPDLTARASVEARRVKGGTAPEQVKDSLQRATQMLESEAEWVRQTRARIPTLDTLLAKCIVTRPV